MKVERRGDARPAEVAVRGMDAETGLAPQRVLRLLHVAVKPGEVDDARHVGLVELDAAPKSILAQGHVRNKTIFVLS